MKSVADKTASMTRPDEIAALADELADDIVSMAQERDSTCELKYDASEAIERAKKMMALRLSATSPGDGVRVKPLEWPPHCPRGQRVHNRPALVNYTIAHYSGDVGDAIYRWAEARSPWSDPLPSYEAAKAAAQADYERHLLAAIAPAEKEYNPAFVKEILAADAATPEAVVKNADELKSFLDAPAEKAGDEPRIDVTDFSAENICKALSVSESVPAWIRTLASAATPTPPSVDVAKVEKRAKEIYDGFAYEGPGNKPAWVNGGNSSKQNDARALAQAETKYDDGEAPWTEDEQFAEQHNACIARRKKYGERHCDEKDGSRTECEHDAQETLRRKYLKPSIESQMVSAVRVWLECPADKRPSAAALGARIAELAGGRTEGASR